MAAQKILDNDGFKPLEAVDTLAKGELFAQMVEENENGEYNMVKDYSESIEVLKMNIQKLKSAINSYITKKEANAAYYDEN